MTAEAPRRVVKLVIEYDGTDFAGWQRQADRPTVQQVLEDALAPVLGGAPRTVAAGRTDAGVHAAGQVVSFRTPSRVPSRGILHGGNSRLPETVSILSAEEMPPGFHARRAAKGKHYRYRILNRPVPSALDARFVHRVAAPLDEGAMARAARHLTGRLDFSSFRNAGSTGGSAVRTVARLDIARFEEYLSVDVEGDGFLYRMVRNLAGTLIAVGLGRMEPDEVLRIREARDRRRAPATAPARGLTLIEVFF